MTAIILAIHTLIVLALVGVVLLQRSEGGALGMGGGGGGFMSGRGAANALTRTTTVLAALFFTSSLALALTADRGVDQSEAFQELTGEEDAPVDVAPGELRQEDLLDIIGAGPEAEPAEEEAPVPATVPEETAPPAETPGDTAPQE